jgi:hypothetical protein
LINRFAIHEARKTIASCSEPFADYADAKERVRNRNQRKYANKDFATVGARVLSAITNS